VAHAGLPTPLDIGNGVLRVFIYCQTEDAIGRISYVDVARDDPTRVLASAAAPVLDIGCAGAFDDHGVVPVSVLRLPSGLIYLYYVGFELCVQVRYRLFTGLAISSDNGASFHKHSRAPVLERSDQELFFRCGSHVIYHQGRFRLWYVGGDAWTELHGKAVPVYDLRYLESEDGINWGPVGQVVMALDPQREHGFGRPYVLPMASGGYEMFYSARRLDSGAYRLGYATSADGLRWTRRDDQLGLTCSPSGWDSQAQCFPAVIDSGAQRYLFYNGNQFGVDGFGVALQQA
jgi:hypothetical protein